MIHHDEKGEPRFSSQEKKNKIRHYVSDLLSSQDLKEVFASFKRHEYEFETFLRPMMREVVAESTFKEGTTDKIEIVEKDEKCWS